MFTFIHYTMTEGFLQFIG